MTQGEMMMENRYKKIFDFVGSKTPGFIKDKTPDFIKDKVNDLNSKGNYYAGIPIRKEILSVENEEEPKNWTGN